VQSDTSKVHQDAVFKAGIENWKKYVLDKTYWPAEYKITNSNVAVVVVRFIVNEDGKVEEPFVATPFHPLMDKIALDVIKKSPAWKPAMEHNRKVKGYFNQPVTFIQEQE
jgi:outer membrane biosynthesis protein TonB